MNIDDVNAEIVRAVQRDTDGDTRGALDALQALLDEGAGAASIVVAINVGVLRGKLGDVDGGIESLLAATEMERESGSRIADESLAHFLEQHGRRDEASALYKSIAENPGIDTNRSERAKHNYFTLTGTRLD